MDCCRRVVNYIEIWSLWQNKTGILPSCSSVITTVWHYHLDFNKTLEENARCELGMGEPHSLLAMYVSVEKQTLDHDWYRERNPQKRPTDGEFSNYRNELVAVYSSQGEDAWRVAI